MIEDQRSSWHSQEAEQNVLGGLMQDAYHFEAVADLIGPEDFYSANHRRIFAVMTALAESGEPLDCITVTEEVLKTGVDLFDYLTDLATNVVSSANLPGYARVIAERSYSRKLADAAKQIEIVASRLDQPSDEKLSEVNTLVADLEQVRDTDSGEEINPILKRVAESIERRFQGEEDPGLNTGFPDLDEKIIALGKAQLIFIAARPSMGKTTLTTNIIRHNLEQGKRALFFSIETSVDRIMERMISDAGEIPLKRILTGKLLEDDWPKLQVAFTKLKDKPIRLVNITDLHIKKARAIARKEKKRKGVDLIALDYAQLMRGDGDSDTSRLEDVSRGLKAMAIENDCPVIAVAQINRGAEKGVNRRPTMADIKACGQFEQDADLVLMIYRDEYYNEDSQYKGTAEIIVGKAKDGETGTVILGTKLQYNKFVNLSNWVPPEPAKKEPKFYGRASNDG